MKVGILTFIHTKNFGANLQCYALQESIARLGHNVEVINLYRPIDKGYVSCKEDNKNFPSLYEYRSIRDYRAKFNKFIANLLIKARKIVMGQSIIDTKDDFNIFQLEYIRFSDKVFHNFTQLYNDFNEQDYSHLVVGSDQVWNYASGFSKEPFFLTFAHNTTKISYAASIGHDKIPTIVEQKYSEWLKDFASISVREITAVEAISRIVDKDVCHVLDPTFLLTKDDWMRLFSIKKNAGERFVLVYMLSVSLPALKLAQIVASQLGCSVKVITHRPFYKKMKNFEFLRNENPRSFVDLYINASFVVTNSFHGTAFAINFGIPFITVSKTGGRLNSRKTNLLNKLGLQDREIFEGENYDLNKLLQIDYEKPYLILDKERDKSIDYLKCSLE